MSWLVAGIGLVILVVVLLNWFSTAQPKAIVGLGKWVFLGLVGLLVIFLIATGRFSMLWLAAMAALPWINRFRMARRMFNTMRGPSGGRTSTVRSRFLEMRLDHDNGDLSGTVIEGQFKGRELTGMAMADLIALLDEISPQDPKSAELLESFLDRTQPADWRETWNRQSSSSSSSSQSGRSDQPPGGGRMTIAEARDILGVDENATEEDIVAAHRRLMKLNHPDRGGSTYLAAKINEAKDILLGT
ncbi:MAG: DnaJ domain-containing protein [Alphaproteobacteria bacterium]